jgi:hypothetical protein
MLASNYSAVGMMVAKGAAGMMVSKGGAVDNGCYE